MTSVIHGVTITELRQILDARGAVLHMIRSDAIDFTSFGECYFSEVAPGAVKAWKQHRTQTQNLAVPTGRIRLVIFDDRQESESRGSLQVIELGRPDAYNRVRIPPGLWYGFSCTSAVPAILANCADTPHDPNESMVRSMNDARMPFDWASGKRRDG